MNNDFTEIQNRLDNIGKTYNRLLELCIYALIRDTDIYKHELDDVTKLQFMKTIIDNQLDDTFTLRQKLINIYKDRKER